jgi:histone acetyltransferase (RNA polymerase elongator complex component)
MKHNNISIFVPHIGCPNMCSFCNQRTISGTQSAPSAEEVKSVCRKAYGEIENKSETEIAFFGGSFTAIPREYMCELLESVQEFLNDGGFKGIRISTRPDCIDREILHILKKYGVTSVELGAQSMCDEVLAANNRGHTADDVVNAVGLLREYGFETGLQMMIGLYKSTAEEERRTWKKIVALSPDTVRIYPTVILEGTELGELYKSGEYVPFDFDTAVDLCAEFLSDAEIHGIRVIKCGLHASEFVEKEMVGGFYHPAFREICESRIYRRQLEKLIDGRSYAGVTVPAAKLSKAIGQKKCNIEYFRERGTELKIIPDILQTEGIKLI